MYVNIAFGAHVWRRDPPCARRRNKEYLLNSLPTIESSILAFHGIMLLTAALCNSTRTHSRADF